MELALRAFTIWHFAWVTETSGSQKNLCHFSLNVLLQNKTKKAEKKTEGAGRSKVKCKKTTNEQRQVADDNHHLPINISYMITPSDHQSQELV